LNRREFLKIAAASGAVLVGGGYWHWQVDRPTLWRAQRTLMGTQVQLTLATDDISRGRVAAAAMFAEMERLIAIFDHRRIATPLARLNQAGDLNDPPAELVELLTLAQQYATLSAGAFDISVKPLVDAARVGELALSSILDRVDYQAIEIGSRRLRLGRAGMALTLDGLAKGRVIDGAVAILRALGFGRVLVEAGGDLSGYMDTTAAEPWRVGVVHPRAPQASPLAVLPVRQRAVATSGDYQYTYSADYRRHHILDPRTGWSPAELASVTVLAPTAADADALSTTLMVLGPRDGLALVERLHHVEALLVAKDLSTYASGGLSGAAIEPG